MNHGMVQGKQLWQREPRPPGGASLVGLSHGKEASVWGGVSPAEAKKVRLEGSQGRLRADLGLWT